MRDIDRYGIIEVTQQALKAINPRYFFSLTLFFVQPKVKICLYFHCLIVFIICFKDSQADGFLKLLFSLTWLMYVKMEFCNLLHSIMICIKNYVKQLFFASTTFLMFLERNLNLWEDYPSAPTVPYSVYLTIGLDVLCSIYPDQLVILCRTLNV